jgi:hypothetical protein
LHVSQDELSGHDARVSIKLGCAIYIGVQIGGKGVYTNELGWTYRGQAREAKADGLGVLTYPSGTTWSGEWSAGVRHGHTVEHSTDGDVEYWLYDRGNRAQYARVGVDGACHYDHQLCAADDARLLVLTAAALDAAVHHPVAAWPAAPDHRIPRYCDVQLCAPALAWGARADSLRGGRRARSTSPQRRRRRSRCATVIRAIGTHIVARAQVHTRTGDTNKQEYSVMPRMRACTHLCARANAFPHTYPARAHTHAHTIPHSSRHSHRHTHDRTRTPTVACVRAGLTTARAGAP